MIKNTLSLLMASVCLAFAAAPATPPAQAPIPLNADRIENIYCGVGVITSIEFITQKSIEQIKIGSPIAEVKYDAERRILDLFPKVIEGKTNMNIVVDGTTYVFVINIINDAAKIDYRRTFTFAREAEALDSAVMSNAPRLKPGEIDVVSAIDQIESARLDPVLREKLGNYRMQPVNKVYQWNGNLIHLLEAHQFVNKDLVVLKVQWLNEQKRAFYIKDSQYQVWVANKQIPVTARVQATDGTVYPGQLETVWLFIQGYRLSVNNPWELKLPPEASSIRQILHN